MNFECRAKVRVGFMAGLHARPATALARLVRRHPRAKVRLVDVRTGAEAAAESILSLLTLGAGSGAELEVVVSGEGAKALLASVVTFLSGGSEEAVG